MGLDANISILRENGEYEEEEFEEVMDNNHWFLNQIISYHRDKCILRGDSYHADFKQFEIKNPIAYQDDNFSEGAIEITEPFILHLETTFIKVIQDTFLGSPVSGVSNEFSFSMSRNLLLIVRLKSALQNKQRLIYMWCW